MGIDACICKQLKTKLSTDRQYVICRLKPIPPRPWGQPRSWGPWGHMIMGAVLPVGHLDAQRGPDGGRVEDLLAAAAAAVLRVGRARLVWRRAGVAAVATCTIERGSAVGATGRTLCVRMLGLVQAGRAAAPL